MVVGVQTVVGPSSYRILPFTTVSYPLIHCIVLPAYLSLLPHPTTTCLGVGVGVGVCVCVCVCAG